jgi:hypothetical protein
MMCRAILPLVALLLAACAAPAQAPPTPANARALDECRDFAESTAPSQPVRGNGAGRSTVYPSRDADSLRTLFDLCLQAKEALR